MVAENNVPHESASGDAPPGFFVVLFALFGAGLTAYLWASECPAKPLRTVLEDQARAIGWIVAIFVLPGLLARKSLVRSLRELICLVPIYLVQLVPYVASMTGGWEGGWNLGIAGAAVGTFAGVAMGWLFTRFSLPLTESYPDPRVRAIALPLGFALLFGFYSAYNWGVAWVTPDEAWWLVLAWLLLALPGALVGRPLLGLLLGSPLILLILVPVVGLLTVGWEGGWIPGLAGAAVGTTAGAVNGWLFNRWIMPEYDKRRAQTSAVQRPENGIPSI